MVAIIAAGTLAWAVTNPAHGWAWVLALATCLVYALSQREGMPGNTGIPTL